MALGNAHLWADPLGEALATVFVGRYGQGVLRYANAGHLPGHRVSRDTEQPLAPTGPLLGLFEHPEIKERQAALPPGFRVVVYTAGWSRRTAVSAAWTRKESWSWSARESSPAAPAAQRAPARAPS